MTDTMENSVTAIPPVVAETELTAWLLEALGEHVQSDYEAARLMMLSACWMADNSKPNSLQASMAKAKAGRMCVDVALRCIELCGSTGYAETELLEKWARDGKILDRWADGWVHRLFIRGVLGAPIGNHVADAPHLEFGQVRVVSRIQDTAAGREIG